MDDAQIKEILSNSKTIAMIGISSEKKKRIQRILKESQLMWL